MKKKAVKKPKVEKVEYFTDEMQKEIYVFPDTYKSSKGGSPIMKSVSFKSTRK